MTDEQDRHDELLEEIRAKPHMSKPDEATFVMYDHTGRWIFEMYVPEGAEFVMHVPAQPKK